MGDYSTSALCQSSWFKVQALIWAKHSQVVFGKRENHKTAPQKGPVNILWVSSSCLASFLRGWVWRNKMVLSRTSTLTIISQCWTHLKEWTHQTGSTLWPSQSRGNLLGNVCILYRSPYQWCFILLLVLGVEGLKRSPCPWFPTWKKKEERIGETKGGSRKD